MSLRAARNAAFLAMIFGATFALHVGVRADDPTPPECKKCTSPTGTCVPVEGSEQGWTGCTETPWSCGIWGSPCHAGD
jgi:hypothetical protein